MRLSQRPHPKSGMRTSSASPDAPVTPAKGSFVSFSFHLTKLWGQKMRVKEEQA